MNGTNKKQARSQRTYQLALESAAVEFARYGFADASLLRMADRMNLTKGALYGHFRSKEEIASSLVAMLDGVLEKLAARSAPAGGVRELRLLSGSVADAIESDVRISAALRLAFDGAQRNEETPEFLTSLRRHALELLAASEEPDERTRVLADLLIVVLVGAYYTAPAPERAGMSARVQDMWDLLAPAPQLPVDG